MKSCPTCDRTYPDDTLAFCLMDGAVLSAPYDPQATRESPDARRASPSPTAVMPRGAISEGNAIPATMPSPPLSTIQAPAPSLPSMPWSAETSSADRPVEVWENKAGRRNVAQNKVRSVVFGLATLAFALLIVFGRVGWEFRLVGAFLAILCAWFARRCWRAARSS